MGNFLEGISYGFSIFCARRYKTRHRKNRENYRTLWGGLSIIPRRKFQTYSNYRAFLKKVLFQFCPRVFQFVTEHSMKDTLQKD